jgi:hypothetical protein
MSVVFALFCLRRRPQESVKRSLSFVSMFLYEDKVKVLGLAFVKLGTSGRWIGTRTGADVTDHYDFDKVVLISAHDSMASPAAYGQDENFSA